MKISRIALATFIAIVPTAPNVGAATTVRSWHDTHGVLHYSNVEGRAPDAAREVALEPVALERDVVGRLPVRDARSGTPRAGSVVAPCGPPNAMPLVRAVEGPVLESREREELEIMLLVAGTPVRIPEGAITFSLPGESSPSAEAALDQGAVAYPAGSPCPDTPPLERYPVAASPVPDGTAGVCGDFRRALAQVGIAGNRNQNVAKSFRAVTRRFVEIAADDYVARDGIMNVELPPWIVEAHIGQARLLAGETDDFVDELQTALEEIDAAARARGCW